ncbi:MAG: glycosyltransferase [Actinomycetota bacterium]
MALGTPVITSDAAALPEVVGNAGQVVTLDLSAWVHATDIASRPSRSASLRRPTNVTRSSSRLLAMRRSNVSCARPAVPAQTSCTS